MAILSGISCRLTQISMGDQSVKLSMLEMALHAKDAVIRNIRLIRVTVLRLELLFVLIGAATFIGFQFLRPARRRRPKQYTTPNVETSPQPAKRSGPSATPYERSVQIRGKCWVIDGDTIVIDRVHIRLTGIDAPELDHPYGKKAKFALMQLCKDHVITATTDGSVSHNRVVAKCVLPDGRDLSAEMVKAGLAIDWGKHSGGAYRHLELSDARKKLWRATLRQQGRFPPTKAD